MLRGVTACEAAAQPLPFFDIRKRSNCGFVRAASGGMLAPSGQPARDRGKIGLRGRAAADFAGAAKARIDGFMDRSRNADLHPVVEGVTEDTSPLLKDSGPIEAI
jgi:hypothetical protein